MRVSHKSFYLSIALILSAISISVAEVIITISPDGIKKQIGRDDDGKCHDKQYMWYLGGQQLVYERICEHGKPVGTWFEWWEDGHTKRKTIWEGEHGRWNYWDESGRKLASAGMAISENDETQIYNYGKVTYRNENGQIEDVIYINDGVLFSVSSSPNKKFTLMKNLDRLSDNQMRYQYRLARKNKPEEPLLDLMECFTHDWPAPNFLWSDDSKYLIYEKCHSTIDVFDLSSMNIVFTTPGVLPISERFLSNFYDRDNNILIFFRANETQRETISLMALHVSTRKVTTLRTVKHADAFDWPLVKLDSRKRQLSFVTWYTEISYGKPINY